MQPSAPSSAVEPVPANARALTKIVATVGPACRGEEQLTDLLSAGVDVFRLNMAHSDRTEHTEIVARIREVGRKLDQPVGILCDLAGPKIRLGELHGGQLNCHQDALVRFVRGTVSTIESDLVTTYEPLIDELSPGDQVMLVDGTVSLVVVERNPDHAVCRVVQPGVVRSRQGVNLPGVKLSVAAMSDADWQNAIWAAEQQIDYVSLSFVRSPVEVQLLKELLRTRGSTAKVVAKIEKQEAVDQLEAIVTAADAVMVARGDLGVEIDVARMPLVQKRIVAMCHQRQKPVIVATQMLDSMQHSRRPTRAEVTDVANAIIDGCDACMLSGETAIGEFPREAVEMMNRIALATESQFSDRQPLPGPKVLADGLHPTTQALVQGASGIAQELGARCIVVASRSGVTALAMAKQRNRIPTIGVSDSESTLRQMCLYWGVTPLASAPTDDPMRLIEHISQRGREQGRLAAGDRILLVTGNGMGTGGHNMALVHEVR